MLLCTVLKQRLSEILYTDLCRYNFNQVDLNKCHLSVVTSDFSIENNLVL